MLTERAVVLVAIEATPGVAQATDPATDAILCDAPDYTVNASKIERQFSRLDLSPFPFRMGRIMGALKFDCEVRGNNLVQSGNTADAPLLTRLFRICGYALQTATATNERVGPVFPELSNIGQATWAFGGALVNTEPSKFTLTCTTAGNAAAARFTVSCNNTDIQVADVAGVVLTGAITLGNTGATVTPTVTTNLAVGDVFHLTVMPMGVRLTPVSSGFESATVECYYDGIKHKLVGAIGTFSLSVDAGGIAKVSINVNGVHQDVIDAALPTPSFDSVDPPLFESALLTWGSFGAAVVSSISVDAAATNAVRDDANAPNGYRGYQYTGRAPAGGMNVEAVTEATNAFWADFAASKQKHFFCRIGTQPGNSMIIDAPRAQTESIKYADKNSARQYDMSISFARFVGNDEVRFFFC